MGLLDIDPGLIIWTLITFIILMILLRKVAWKPILAMIDEREATIRESLEEAEQARADAEATMQEYQQKLKEARQEARQIIDESKESAEKIRAEIVEEGEQQKQKMISEAREQIEAERERAVQDIKDSVAEIAISAASRIINQELSAESHRDIIDRSLQQFKASK
ncbi:MAG: F0F1 ATP synthase subunit B [Candidatus Marinimicrobia bacterium]|nr:F0F1 ATP synthase subunit B [Candidatus Neomarinimicrobiota bacterium]MCF7829893.1 F0F1 ATP synthase subunit B [Candidatus Neomarinimicrobiota bacterium]MCF7879144.1 F0F1 ATP synthase subunit B [Candidatus Neomarinimicrobiota bacterium]